MKRVLTGIAMSGLVLVTQAFAEEQFFVNAAITESEGQRVRGPATLNVVGLNPIRYEIKIGSKVTYTAATSLSGLAFIPSLGSPAPESQTPTSQTIPANVRAETSKALKDLSFVPTTTETAAVLFADYISGPDRLNHLEIQKVDLTRAINSLIADLNAQISAIRGLSSAADAVLKTGGEAGPSEPVLVDLLGQVTAVSSTVKVAATKPWPEGDISALTGKLLNLKNLFVTMPSRATDWTTWIAVPSNKSSYDAALSRVDALIKSTTELGDPTGTSVVGFRQLQKQLIEWGSTLDAVVSAGSQESKSPFQHVEPRTCGLAFGGGREDKIELVLQDRFAPAGTTAVRRELVTVVCDSPISVSAGFGFSTVDESVIEFVQSNNLSEAGKLQSVFGQTGTSSFQAIPLLFLNTRVWEPSDWFSLHLSGGAGVDLGGDSEGSDVEYVVGPSLSFRRSMFVTLGWHLGRVGQLSPESGFKIGDVVPTGLAAPPIQKRWTNGFALALTWKIR